MRYVFFEQPYALIPLLIVAAYVCLVVWLRRRTVRAKRALWIAAILLVLLPVVQRLVVTDRERIRAVSAAIAAAVDAGDVAALSEHVADDFRVRDIDRAALLELAKSAMDRHRPRDVKLSDVRVTVTGDRAEVTQTSTCFVESDVYSGRVTVNWTAVFVRARGAWRLQFADIRPTPLLPIDQLEDVR